MNIAQHLEENSHTNQWEKIKEGNQALQSTEF